MAKIEIAFPQVVLYRREIEVDDDLAESIVKNGTDAEKAEFIFNRITESEQEHTEGEQWITKLMEFGMAWVKKV